LGRAGAWLYMTIVKGRSRDQEDRDLRLAGEQISQSWYTPVILTMHEA
jgi:hypothetical protein